MSTAGLARQRRFGHAGAVARLVLFDIDGTLLLRASAEHRDAVHEAIRAVWPAVGRFRSKQVGLASSPSEI